jgi:putative addiction module CopG family antidote
MESTIKGVPKTIAAIPNWATGDTQHTVGRRKRMSIQLPPSDQQAAEQLVAMGRYSSVEDVVSEGIRQLLNAEQLRAKVNVGIEQADRGEVVDHDTAFNKLRSLAATLDGQAE